MRNFFNYLITAARYGDSDVFELHVIEMAWQVGILCGVFLLWLILRIWFFPTFSPSAYWNISGKTFWEMLPGLCFPVVIYPVVMVQSYWISKDQNDERSVAAQGIIFKWFRSLFAGIVEEIGYRGILIYFGLIFVCISNRFFNWVIAIVFICSLISVLNSRMIIVAKIILVVALLGCWYGLSQVTGGNPVLTINKWILMASSFVAQKFWLKYLVGSAVAVLAMIHTMIMKDVDDETSLAEAIYKTIVITVWFGYVFPLGIGTLAKIAIPPNPDQLVGFVLVPLGSDQWAALLYASAIMSINVLFRNAHVHHGGFGMFNSWLLGLYFIHIAFTYGLVFAMAIHFIFDFTLFTGEHIIALVRNAGMSRYSFRV